MLSPNHVLNSPCCHYKNQIPTLAENRQIAGETVDTSSKLQQHIPQNNSNDIYPK